MKFNWVFLSENTTLLKWSNFLNKLFLKSLITKPQFYILFRCPIYTDLPSFCRLVKAAPGECCERVKCDQGTGSQTGVSSGVVTIGTTVTPKPSCSWCKDNIDNCNAYGKSACQKPYVSWANRNCANYCDFCSMYHFK